MSHQEQTPQKYHGDLSCAQKLLRDGEAVSAFGIRTRYLRIRSCTLYQLSHHHRIYPSGYTFGYRVHCGFLGTAVRFWGTKTAVGTTPKLLNCTYVQTYICPQQLYIYFLTLKRMNSERLTNYFKKKNTINGLRV